MAKQPRPATVVMIAFATGSVTIKCVKTKAEILAMMNVPLFGTYEKDGADFEGSPTEVQIPSVSETDVKEDPRSSEIVYRLKNEIIGFYRKDVVFWSVAEAVDPPDPSLVQLINPQGIIK